MAAQFQYSRLAHQAQAVQSLAQVFENVAFQPALHSQANPIFKLTDDNKKVTDNLATLKANIEQVRQANGVTLGPVDVSSVNSQGLALDIMMETGTGKTFTFIEAIHLLHQRHRRRQVSRLQSCPPGPMQRPVEHLLVQH